jgi:hypothetical protein
MLFDPFRGRISLVDNGFSIDILSRWDKEGIAPSQHNTSATAPPAGPSETLNSVQSSFKEKIGLV